jgi:hypothetical protein
MKEGGKKEKVHKKAIRMKRDSIKEDVNSIQCG